MAFFFKSIAARAILATGMMSVAGAAFALETVKTECFDSNNWQSENAFGERDGILVSAFARPDVSNKLAAIEFYGVVADCREFRSLLIDTTGEDNMQARIDFAFYFEALAKKARSDSLEELEVEFIQAGLRTEIVRTDAAACICQSEGDS